MRPVLVPTRQRSSRPTCFPARTALVRLRALQPPQQLTRTARSRATSSRPATPATRETDQDSCWARRRGDDHGRKGHGASRAHPSHRHSSGETVRIRRPLRGPQRRRDDEAGAKERRRHDQRRDRDGGRDKRRASSPGACCCQVARHSRISSAGRGRSVAGIGFQGPFLPILRSNLPTGPRCSATALCGDSTFRTPKPMRAFKKIGVGSPEPYAKAGVPEENFIDLYLALFNVETIGRSLLGPQDYAAAASWLRPRQAAIVVAANGDYSFRGSGFVRGGIFDRLQLVQNDATILVQGQGLPQARPSRRTGGAGVPGDRSLPACRRRRISTRRCPFASSCSRSVPLARSRRHSRAFRSPMSCPSAS